MTACKYALKSDPSKTLDASNLGYWAVKWAADQAPAALRAFQQPPLSDFPIIRAAVEQPFHMSLVLIALHGAVYWAVAAGIPALNGQIDRETCVATLEELRRGRDDCLGELLLPSGGAHLPDATASQVKSLFERFHGDLLHDLSQAAPADAEGISRTTASFVTILKANFKNDFPPEQQRVFGQFVDGAVRKLMAHVQDALEIR